MTPKIPKQPLPTTTRDFICEAAVAPEAGRCRAPQAARVRAAQELLAYLEGKPGLPPADELWPPEQANQIGEALIEHCKSFCLLRCAMTCEAPSMARLPLVELCRGIALRLLRHCRIDPDLLFMFIFWTAIYPVNPADSLRAAERRIQERRVRAVESADALLSAWPIGGGASPRRTRIAPKAPPTEPGECRRRRTRHADPAQARPRDASGVPGRPGLDDHLPPGPSSDPRS